MAQLTVNVDTEKGFIDVSINGKKVKDVSSANVYKARDYDEGGEKVNFNVTVQVEDNEVKQFIMYSSSENKVVESASKVDKETYPGSVGVAVGSQAQEDIKKFLSK